MQLCGSKIKLRELRASDELAFITAVKNSQELLSPWVSPADTSKAFADYLKQTQCDNQCSFLITSVNEDALIGVINISNIIRGCFQSAYLGYYCFEGYQRQGLMLEAMNLIIDYAFFHLGLHRLEANIQPHNIASINLVKRCGFVNEGLAKNYLNINGRWQDHSHYALTLEQAQHHWIVLAEAKEKPWLPDFEFSSAALKNFLVASDDFTTVSSVKGIGCGWDNDVYLVNDHWVFRCPRRRVAASLIERENRVLNIIAEQLPLAVPKPVYQYLGPSNYPYPFHGYQKLNGSAVHEAALSAVQRSASVVDFAYFLKALHQIPVQEVLATGVGPQVFDRTQTVKIKQQIDHRVKVLSEQGIIAINPRHIDKLCNQALTVILDKNQHCLVHGDLYCRHLLYDNGALTAVIDWGDVGLNHPVVDLAALYSVFPQSSHQSFYNIYGDIDESHKIYARFLAVHSILACIDYALDHQEPGLLREVTEALARID